MRSALTTSRTFGNWSRRSSGICVRVALYSAYCSWRKVGPGQVERDREVVGLEVLDAAQDDAREAEHAVDELALRRRQRRQGEVAAVDEPVAVEQHQAFGGHDPKCSRATVPRTALRGARRRPLDQSPKRCAAQRRPNSANPSEEQRRRTAIDEARPAGLGRHVQQPSVSVGLTLSVRPAPLAEAPAPAGLTPPPSAVAGLDRAAVLRPTGNRLRRRREAAVGDGLRRLERPERHPGRRADTRSGVRRGHGGAPLASSGAATACWLAPGDVIVASRVAAGSWSPPPCMSDGAPATSRPARPSVVRPIASGRLTRSRGDAKAATQRRQPAGRRRAASAGVSW